MLKVDILTLFAILGTVHGLFFSILLLSKRKSSLSNKMLALFLIATSIRIAKNIVVHTTLIDPDLEYPIPLWRTAVNFGLAHQFAIGPLFLLYFQSCLKENFRFRSIYYLHFIPYFLLIPFSPFIKWAFWYYGGLWASYIAVMTYFLLAFYTYYQAYLEYRNNPISQKESILNWLKWIIIIVGVLLLIYSPALFKYVGYVGGSILYTIGIYVISMIILKERKSRPLVQRKYQTSSLKEEQLSPLKQALEKAMQNEKMYLDPELTLTKLAKHLTTSPNHLSQLINSIYQKSYSDYINDLRVAEVSRLLKQDQAKTKKIVSLAFESGFNSISSFYTVFKKRTGMTPSEYRDQITT